MVAAPLLLHVLLICPAVALGLQLPSSPLPSASFTSSMRAYKDAASACAAIARDPASGEAWRCLGRLLHGKGRLEAARTALTRATELAPTDAATQIGLANVLRSIGRFDEAVAALAAAESLTGQQDQSLCYFRTPGTAAAATPAPEAASLGGVASRQVRVQGWGVRVKQTRGPAPDPERLARVLSRC
jgi:tetratricopeptide (TPR) repeat protein